MTDWTVRFITEQDEVQVVDLHRRAFPHDRRTVEHQRWKYTANPFGEPIRVGAFAPDGRLATHVSAYALPMVQAGPAGRRDLRVRQIGDSMTDPEFRRVGHGRRGLFAQAMQRLVDAGREHGMDIVYGVAPARLQRFYVRHVDGSELLLDIPFRRARIRDDRPVDASDWPRHGETSRYGVADLAPGDTRVDRLFGCTAPSFGILVRRDAAYLAWRYHRSPDHRYLMIAAEQNGALVGWSVFRRAGDELLWGDALFDPDHTDAVRPVLARALALSPGVTGLSGWFRDRPGWWARTLESVGLVRAPEPHDQSVISACYPRPGVAAVTGDHLREGLYFTMGDSDLF